MVGEKKKEGRGMSRAPPLAAGGRCPLCLLFSEASFSSQALSVTFSLFLSFFLSFSHLRGRAVQWVVESAVCEAARGAPPPSVIVGKRAKVGSVGLSPLKVSWPWD